MSGRDRRASLILFAIAAAGWVAVGWVGLNLDPRADPANGFLGAAAIAVASGFTATPLFWLAAYGRQHRIAYRGDWVRAARRAGWVAALSGVLVILRLQGIFQAPVALFLVTMVALAEMTLSAQR